MSEHLTLIVDGVPRGIAAQLMASAAQIAPGASLRLLARAEADPIPSQPPQIPEDVAPSEADGERAALAEACAQALLPLIREGVGNTRHLLGILGGGHSDNIAFADDSDSPRGMAVAIAKKLKRALPGRTFSGLASPIDLLVVRGTAYHRDGGYKSRTYEPTPLGRSVRTRLVELAGLGAPAQGTAAN